MMCTKVMEAMVKNRHIQDVCKAIGKFWISCGTCGSTQSIRDGKKYYKGEIEAQMPRNLLKIP